MKDDISKDNQIREETLLRKIDEVCLITYHGKEYKSVKKYEKQIFEYIRDNVFYNIERNPAYFATIVRTLFRIFKRSKVSISGYVFIQRLSRTEDNMIMRKIKQEYSNCKNVIQYEGYVRYNYDINSHYDVHEIIEQILNDPAEIKQEVKYAIDTIKYIDSITGLIQKPSLRKR